MKNVAKFLFTATLALGSILAVLPAHAEDQIYIFDGHESRYDVSPKQTTFAFNLEYMHDFSQYMSWSVEYGNQGHFNVGTENHQDFFDAMFWLHKDILNNQVRFAVGAGPVYFLDTTGGPAGYANQDVHGTGMTYSVAATLLTFDPVLVQARMQWVRAGNVNTRAVMLGVGWELGKKDPLHIGYSSGVDEREALGIPKNEISVGGGRSLVNVSATGHTDAISFAYRHEFTPYLEGEVGYLDEGKSMLTQRKGVNTELFATKQFYDNRISLGAGGGLYVGQDKLRPGRSGFVAPVVSVEAAYRITEHFDARIQWDRVITNYNRDADVYTASIGYRW